jgi:murein DD-endopeptidase
MPARAIQTCYTSLLLMLCLYLLTGCSSAPERAVNANHGHDGLAQAARMLGRPYRYGGAAPSGFDCSGLIYYAYRKAGIAVPRTTREQYRQARRIPTSRLRPGDLVFFRINGRDVSHVAIYAGGQRILHAPSSGKQVTYGSLGSPYWRRHLAAAGRYE